MYSNFRVQNLAKFAILLLPFLFNRQIANLADFVNKH